MLARGEVEAARDEVNNRRACLLLGDALSTGMAEGRVGSLDTACVRAEAVEEAVADVRHRGVKTAEARQLLHTAQVVRDLRRAVQAEDWAQVFVPKYGIEKRVYFNDDPRLQAVDFDRHKHLELHVLSARAQSSSLPSA